jgi:hypothetical protein
MAELLAESFEVDPAQAFLAGLLHDAGELLTFRLLRTAHDKRGGGREPWSRNLPFVRAVARRYHTHLGALFIMSWELPASVGNSLVYHHHPTWKDLEYANLVQLVHAANALSEVALRHGRSKAWQTSIEGWRDASPKTGIGPTVGSDGVDELPLGPIHRLLPEKVTALRLQKIFRTVLLRMDGSDLAALKDEDIATLPD